MSDKKYSVLDLQAGIGGKSFAAESIGFSTVCAIGGRKAEKDVYCLNLGDIPYVSDGVGITARNLPGANIVMGKLSLQTISVAGRMRNPGTYGWELELLAEIIREKKPESIILTVNGGRYAENALDKVKKFLQDRGYWFKYREYDTQQTTGMPVREKMMYFVAFLSHLSDHFQFPAMQPAYEYQIRNLLIAGSSQDAWCCVPDHVRKWIGDAEVYNRMAGAEGIQYLEDNQIRYNTSYPTIVRDSLNLRKIMPRELARTRFFPDNFILTEDRPAAMYRGVAESVNIRIFSAVLEQIGECLRQNNVPCYEPKRETVKLTDISNQLKKRHEQKPVSEEQKSEPSSEGGKGVMSEAVGKRSKIFLSYCQRDSGIADLVETKLSAYLSGRYTISRDIRDVEYGESFCSFMNKIREHEIVLMLISDRYLKSINCMYEMMEVFKDSNYSKKLHFIVLSDEDGKYLKTPEESKGIGADLYSSEGRGKYVVYWDKERKKLEEMVNEISAPVFAQKQLEEQARVIYIQLKLAEFFDYISDRKGLSLAEHLETGFAQMRKLFP